MTERFSDDEETMRILMEQQQKDYVLPQDEEQAEHDSSHWRRIPFRAKYDGHSFSACVRVQISFATTR